MKSKNTVYTIGHAARTIEEFTAMLLSQGVDVLVDVRSVPRSRRSPHFNDDALPQALSESGIGYIRIPELGGFRAKSKTVPPGVNGFWENNSFHSYADYAMTEPFQSGLTRLIEEAAVRTPAIMCAEILWWRCHRRIITDYLLANGQKVFHIIHQNKVEPARISANAKIDGQGRLSYPQM